MPKQELLCKMKAYIQPFERQLALMELESAAGGEPIPEPGFLDGPLVYRVNPPRSLDYLAETLTYWETVGLRSTANGRYTHQVRREATANVVRNGISPAQLREMLPFNGNAIPIPNRRVLRYGPHGAHEYRGKFFPQLVRSLLNAAGVRTGDIVFDPMCGSGTMPVEASLLGCRAIGLDLNPLSVLMSRAKCAIFHTSPDVLASEYESMRGEVLNTR